MKKLFLIAILTVSVCFTAASAQTAAPPDAPIVRAQLIGALERAQREVKASRNLIDALREQVEAKEKRIKAHSAKDELGAAAINGLQSEIANLRAAITKAKSALEIRRAQVADLEDDLDKTRSKLKRARTVVKFLAIAAGVLGGISLVK